MHMTRRDEVRDMKDSFRQQVWYLNPARHDELYFAGFWGLHKDAMTESSDEEQIEEAVVDLDEYDKYFENFEEVRSMTGEQMAGLLDDGGWL